MKGAIGSVLSISQYIYKNGKEVKLTRKDIDTLNALNVEYSKKSMRVLAFGYGELKDDKHDYEMDEVEKHIIFLGLMALF